MPHSSNYKKIIDNCLTKQKKCIYTQAYSHAALALLNLKVANMTLVVHFSIVVNDQATCPQTFKPFHLLLKFCQPTQEFSLLSIVFLISSLIIILLAVM